MIATLDLSRPDQLEDYERAFFAAFAPLTHNQLIRRLWHWDEAAGRLRTSVPYQEQLIFVRRDERGTIIAALAVGTRLQTVQSNYYGFEVPRGHRHCESLTFFNVGERRMRDTMSFWRFCRDELRARGFSKIYATTAPRVMPVYLWVGGEILDARDFDGQTRYFFQIDMEKRATRRTTPTSVEAEQQQ